WVRTSIGLLVMHMSAACISLSLTNGIDRWHAGLGVSTFSAGMAFWFWARLRIAPLRVRRMPDDVPPTLYRDGAFGLVRHPLYFGVLRAALAPIVVVPRLELCVTFARCCVALAIRAVQEERRLRVQLGAAYDDYCREVKRLLPFVW